MQRAEKNTHERCLEAVTKLEAVKTHADFQAVVDWIGKHDWFLRSREDNELMKNAFNAAWERTKNEKLV